MRWPWLSSLLLSGALLVATPACAQTRPSRKGVEKAQTLAARLGAGIEERTLANGLRVVVWPDPDNASVVLYNWFRVGSRNEAPGITGLSHFFEHMMFNGAKKYGPGEFDRVMEAAGGSNNATTSEDVTVYMDWFPRSALETIFELEADRLQHLAIDPKVVESERGVVYSERRSSVDNDNAGLLAEQVQSAAFTAHPYHFPTIGWPSDIEAWRQEDLERFFRTYYAPNNATLVVTGAVTPAEVFALAERHLAGIPAQPPPPEVRTREPEQRGERRVTVRKEAQAPLLQVAYHAFAAKDAEAPALELLLGVLAGGDASRLHRRLVEEERVAIHVDASFRGGFDPSLAWLQVDLPPGGDPVRAEALLDAELAKVVREGVTDAELARARNVALADFWRQLETNNGRARALGTYAVFHGGWRQLFDAPARLEAVTREAVQKVAVKVLRRSNRTVGVLVPEEAQQTRSTEAAR
ncbi:MAG: insulinase family protein [Myxococcaceae bacterium]|nr:insulinase family protein [Myxococcaceae bacterium]